MGELNQACCSLPAVTTHNYNPKGSYIDLAGLKHYTYIPSPNPIRGIIAVYDIFGFTPQTIQGCDRIAASTNAMVVMPDFFVGEPLSLNLYPPDTEEKKKIATDFMSSKADLPRNIEKLMGIRRELGERYAGVKRWAVYGLCWGGKVASLVSEEASPFVASGQAHPGGLAVQDAEKVAIPHICLFSQKDGDAELVKKYKEALKAKKDVEIEDYTNMLHGWMGARGFYSGEESVKGFERGYAQLAAFFKKHFEAAERS